MRVPALNRQSQAGDNVINVKPYLWTREDFLHPPPPPQDVYFSSIKPIIYFLIALGKLPITRNSVTGEIVHRHLSWIMAYSVVSYSLQTVAVCIIYYQWATLLFTVKALDTILQAASVLVGLLPHFQQVFGYWCESKHFANYISQWQLFEKQFYAVMGKAVAINFRISAGWALTIMVLAVFALTMSHQQLTVLEAAGLIEIIVSFSVCCTIGAVVIFWGYTCAAKEAVASALLSQLCMVGPEITAGILKTEMFNLSVEAQQELVSTTVTYLIVLLQFRASAPKDQFTEEPFLFQP